MGYSKLQNRIIKSINISGRRTKKLAFITPNIRFGKKSSSGNMVSNKPIEKYDEDNME